MKSHRSPRTVLVLVLAVVWLAPMVSAAGDYLGVEWLLRGQGGRVDWGPDKRIAYDAPGTDGYTDVWVMDENGQNRRCLTDRRPGIPQLHNGNPAWHPNGKLLVFQSLDPEIKAPMAGTPLYRLYTGPGAGFHNDLWVMQADGQKSWRLTRVGRGKGVLHPHFSHDGRWLVWAEMLSDKPRGLGTWEIVLARFEYDAKGARLGQTRRLTPKDLGFYETHGFSPDDRSLIFSGVPRGLGEDSMDIYVSDLDGENCKPLTELREKQWDEHAHFSPDGNHIVWMSSAENGLKPDEIHNLKVKTDYWMMDHEGRYKKRLTFFNHKGTPHSLPGKNIASDLSFSPEGDRIVFYIQDKGKKMFTWGSIGILELR